MCEPKASNPALQALLEVEAEKADANAFVSACCIGEKCTCGRDAAHKVEEVIFDDDPNPVRHPLTVYLCRLCFWRLMLSRLK